MSITIAIILGLVQGLTEFIPVSSSGHLEIVQQLAGNRAGDFHLFLELINIGTVLALMIFFRKRIMGILNDIFVKKNFRLALNIIITCIPAGIMGLLLSDFISSNAFFSSMATIATAMFVIGVAMYFSDRLPHAKKLKDETKLTKPKAFAIGCAQVLALIPGVSRSGSTILAGRMAGLNSKSAAEYSFLVSIPLMCAVCLKTLIDSDSQAYLANNLGTLILSNVIAFCAGMFALRFVMSYIKKSDSLKAFGLYRIILATIIFIALLIQL